MVAGKLAVARLRASVTNVLVTEDTQPGWFTFQAVRVARYMPPFG